jgi:hypothetical protein
MGGPPRRFIRPDGPDRNRALEASIMDSGEVESPHEFRIEPVGYQFGVFYNHVLISPFFDDEVLAQWATDCYKAQLAAWKPPSWSLSVLGAERTPLWKKMPPFSLSDFEVANAAAALKRKREREMASKLADYEARLDRLRAEAKPKPDDSPETKVARAAFGKLVEGGQAGGEKSGETRRKKRDKWVAYVAVTVSKWRSVNKSLTQEDVVEKFVNGQWDAEKAGCPCLSESSLTKLLSEIW